MQPFCFFVATKEVGVWGLVPTNNKELINVIVLFPAARGVDFVKRTKKCECFSFIYLEL